MCLRYTLWKKLDDLRRAMEIREALEKITPIFPEFDDRPRYNIAPSQTVPIVTLHDGQRRLAGASWGFIPFWAKEEPKKKPGNAMSEKVATNGMWREAFKTGRCLMPADGFYEWLKDTSPRTPYYFHRPDNAIFAFAGLVSRWREQTTCAMLTTTPNPLVARVHDRMAVLLHREDYGRWLDPDARPDDLLALLRPYPDDELVMQEVSTRVNKSTNQGKDLIEPVPPHVEDRGLF